ncbi:hypothetical protein ACIQC5_08125 [Paenarthrobacter sp. NPDC092416]|uniref:hypothetical protein n=1 Tax=Paenarthrobacter sp. NPDC092416 TaxID=3364386 RepID=UPI003809BD9D
MNVNELTSRIQVQHNVELTEFRRNLTGPQRHASPFRETGHHSASAHVPNADRRSVRLGPVQSLEDGNANLTIVADVEGLAWFTADSGLLGSCITVSIAGHRRNTGTRAPLPLDECDAWVRAILGGSWIPHVYRAGNTGAGEGKTDIASYRLFLDERRNPTAKPSAVNDQGLRRLGES